MGITRIHCILTGEGGGVTVKVEGVTGKVRGVAGNVEGGIWRRGGREMGKRGRGRERARLWRGTRRVFKFFLKLPIIDINFYFLRQLEEKCLFILISFASK